MEKLLKQYSEFLEEYGYIDADWREEKPTAVDRFLSGEDKRFPVEAVVSDDLVREVETKFRNTMLGITEIPTAYPQSYYNNTLIAAYNQAQAHGLNLELTLKHCCTVLQNILNEHQTEKIMQALNSR